MAGLRYLGPVLVVALGLAASAVFAAWSLFREQSTLTSVLSENIHSRNAAVELSECLTDLAALENDRVETVAVLHDRVRVLLRAVDHAADQPDERTLFDEMHAGFQRYVALWQSLPPIADPRHDELRGDATRILESGVRKPCDDLIAYNSRRIDESAATHRRDLRQLAWGLGIVGGLGTVAGIVLGYGVARSLRRSIGRLHVQIQDAAGKLGPALVLTGESGFTGLHGDIDRLSARIEQMLVTLREREHEVLRAEQLAAVGQLAAGVGHEIRNPLTAIKMLVQAALESGSPPDATDLTMIEGEVRRMERSLQTFLNLARPPRAERGPMDLASVVRGVAALLRGRAEQQRVSLAVDVPSGGVPAFADDEQIRQVVVNLGMNALDAMPGGGELTLSAHTSDAGTAVLTVDDRGPGISPTLGPRLFQPFASTKDTGLGMGLAISRRIAEDHAGTLAAEPRDGGGTRFTLTLPTDARHADALAG